MWVASIVEKLEFGKLGPAPGEGEDVDNFFAMSRRLSSSTSHQAKGTSHKFSQQDFGSDF